MPEPSCTSESTPGRCAAAGLPGRSARSVAAFRAGDATATEAELAAFLAWARGVRIEGGGLSLILQGMVLPIGSEGGGGYQFGATGDEERPG